MKRFILFAGLTLLGCKPEESQPGISDTGDITGDEGGGGDEGGESGGDAGGDTCTAELLESTPYDGEAGFYYRSPIILTFDSQADQEAEIQVLVSGGGEIPTAVSWDEGGINAYVAPDGLTGDASYEIQIVQCEETTLIAFSTDEYGKPMTASTDELVGNTYLFDMGGAEYVKPAGLGPLIGNYLTEPMLFGVSAATESEISIVGAQGGVNDTSGEIYQVTDLPTWDFGTADFSDSPFFRATADEVGIDYEDVTVNIYSFEIEGTFAADGSSIGGGIGKGLADTRYLGEIIGLGTGWYEVCDFVASAGLECEECPDGEITCMTLEAHFDDADLVEGLTIEASSEGSGSGG